MSKSKQERDKSLPRQWLTVNSCYVVDVLLSVFCARWYTGCGAFSNACQLWTDMRQTQNDSFCNDSNCLFAHYNVIPLNPLQNKKIVLCLLIFLQLSVNLFWVLESVLAATWWPVQGVLTPVHQTLAHTPGCKLLLTIDLLFLGCIGGEPVLESNPEPSCYGGRACTKKNPLLTVA